MHTSWIPFLKKIELCQKWWLQITSNTDNDRRHCIEGIVLVRWMRLACRCTSGFRITSSIEGFVLVRWMRLACRCTSVLRITSNIEGIVLVRWMRLACRCTSGLRIIPIIALPPSVSADWKTGFNVGLTRQPRSGGTALHGMCVTSPTRVWSETNKIMNGSATIKHVLTPAAGSWTIIVTRPIRTRDPSALAHGLTRICIVCACMVSWSYMYKYNTSMIVSSWPCLWIWFNCSILVIIWPFLADIGEIAGVAEVTIRQSYKLMYPRAQQLFPEDFRFHTNIDHLPTS
jgi:hypothetical protein